MFKLTLSFILFIAGSLFLYDVSTKYWVSPAVIDIEIRDKQEDWVGLFYSLDANYQSMGEAKFIEFLKQYPTQNNMPLRIVERKKLKLPDDMAQTLDNSEPLVANTSPEVLFYRIKSSDIYIMIGPMRVIDDLQNAVYLYDGIYYTFIVMCIIAWFVFLAFKVRKLEKVANRLGEGDLGARASEKVIDQVGTLNKSFNQMAQRIGSLIDGHKQLTNAVAHEFRTPIARLRFQLDLLDDDKDLPEKHKQRIYSMADDVEELSTLVEELLVYARYDRGQVNETLESVIVASLVEELKKHTNYKEGIETNWPEVDATLRLNLNAKLMVRALSNLVNNAKKYAEKQVNLTVKVEQHTLAFIVEDDGRGIEAEHYEKVFEPFYRIDNSRTRETGGHGLGLAIVKQVSKIHDGKIEVGRSDLGGARFTLTVSI